MGGLGAGLGLGLGGLGSGMSGSGTGSSGSGTNGSGSSTGSGSGSSGSHSSGRGHHGRGTNQTATTSQMGISAPISAVPSTSSVAAGFGNIGSGLNFGAGLGIGGASPAGTNTGTGRSPFTRGAGTNTQKGISPPAPQPEAMDASDYSAYDSGIDDSNSSEQGYGAGVDTRALFEKHRCARHGCGAPRQRHLVDQR